MYSYPTVAMAATTTPAAAGTTTAAPAGTTSAAPAGTTNSTNPDNGMYSYTCFDEVFSYLLKYS